MNRSKPARPGLGSGEARTDEAALADQRMGNNRLQGDDQQSVRNERHAAAGEKDETEGVIESFENLDPKVRAERRPQKKGPQPAAPSGQRRPAGERG